MRRLLPLLILPVFLSAQEPDPEASPTPIPTPTPPPRAQVLFSVYVWPTEGILMEDTRIAGLPRVFYQSPTGPQPVRLTRNTATPLMPYAGELPLELFDIKEIWTDPPPDAPPGTQPTVQRVPDVKIRAEFPVRWNRVLLVLFPDRKAPDGTLLTMALPYDREALKPGMARIYNGSRKPLVLKFEDAEETVLSLPPFEGVDFNPKNLTGNQFSRIFIYARAEDGDLEMAHTSKLFFQEETTNYFFLYPQGRRRLRIMRVAGHEEETADDATLFQPPPTGTPSPRR